MYTYKKILARLSLEDTDRDIIRYAAKISELAELEEIKFCYKLPELPEFLHGKSEEDVEADALDEIQTVVKETFDGCKGTKLSFAIIKGNELYGILTFAKDEKSDLVITTKETPANLAEKLARKSPCSLMAVTADSDPSLKKILVLTDFSKFSENALDVGIRFATGSNLKELSCAHIFSIPYGYGKTGLNQKELLSIEKQWIQKEFEKFALSVNNRGIQIKQEIIQNSYLVKGVENYVVENDIDLVITASRGKDAISALLLGSLSSDLLRATTVPIIIAKEKGTGLSFLNNLLHNY